MAIYSLKEINDNLTNFIIDLVNNKGYRIVQSDTGTDDEDAYSFSVTLFNNKDESSIIIITSEEKNYFTENINYHYENDLMHDMWKTHLYHRVYDNVFSSSFNETMKLKQEYNKK